MKPLSPRQREVIILVAHDLTEEQIAHHLGISIHTVNWHRRCAFQRLDASTRLRAILNALKQGFIRLDDVA